jgi:hypothetical protein
MKDSDLDAMLKEMLSSDKEYIADDGFTAAVLGALPGPRTSPLLRYAIIGACAAVAGTIALFISPGFEIITGAIIDVAQCAMTLRIPSLVSIAVVGLSIWGAIVPVRMALRRTL